MRGVTICLLAVIGLASEARAACMERTLEVFPSPDAVLPTNGQIVLTVPRHLKRQEGRTPWRTLTLRAETERVPLKVVETLRSADGDMQMVLVPAAPLRPETTYELAIADIPRPVHRDLDELLAGALPGRASEFVRFVWTTAPTSRPAFTTR